MSSSLIQVRHYHLRQHTLEDGSTMATTDLPATIATDAIEAAKGGHIVALHLPDADSPVLVDPGADHTAVTQQIATMMGGHPGDLPWEADALDAEAAPAKAKRGKKADIPLDE